MPKLTIRGTRFISGADAMFPRIAMGLRHSSLLNGCNDPSVRRDRSGWLGAKLEGEHASPMSLIGDGLSNSSDAPVAAALDQSSMEQVVSGSQSLKITVK